MNTIIVRFSDRRAAQNFYRAAKRRWGRAVVLRTHNPIDVDVYVRPGRASEVKPLAERYGGHVKVAPITAAPV